MNSINVVGKIISPIRTDHYIRSNDYVSFIIATKRLSLVDDELIVVMSGKRARELELQVDDFVEIHGEVHSYNYEGKLKVFIYPISINLTEDFYRDEVTAIGKICKKPELRHTPLGSQITNITLAVNRDRNKSDYIPVITWNHDARTASGFRKGDLVYVKGRLQSRKYEKDNEIKTTTELSCSQITKV